MEIDWFLRIALLIGLLLLAAFFSGCEAALFLIDKNKIKDLKNSHPLIGNYIVNLTDYPKRLLVTILLSSTLVIVLATQIAMKLASDMAIFYKISLTNMLYLQFFGTVLLIFTFGQIIPKLWAAKHPVKIITYFAGPLYWISVFLYPFSKIITDLIDHFSKRPGHTEEDALLVSEKKEMMELRMENGSLEDTDTELIEGIVSFSSVTAREVMTPRVDISAVASDSSIADIMQLIEKSGHSRLPLYTESLDEIVGIIYAKDLIKFFNNKELKDISLQSICREALFIPESKLISDLLREFQEKKTHIGIVIDEYGGTAGLVTMEDILEEIVGEIRDEYDTDEIPITMISEKQYLVLGSVPIEDFNEKFNIDLKSENDDFDTVGGFILNNAGSIPHEGYSFMHASLKFTVKEVQKKRIKKILVEIVDMSIENEEQETPS